MFEWLFSRVPAEARVRFFIIYMFISGFAVCASGNDHHFEEDFVQTFFAKEKHLFFNPELGTDNGKSDTPTNNQQPTTAIWHAGTNKIHRQRPPTINSLQSTTDTRHSTTCNYHLLINPATKPTPDIQQWLTDRRNKLQYKTRLEARTTSCFICHKLEADNDRPYNVMKSLSLSIRPYRLQT